MQESNLADKYRPERFEDVWGQPHAKRYLSGLIKRGQIGRSLLLFGAVGSGKTSLVRLYAKALNCEKPTDTGSPCGFCRYCIEPEPRNAGLYEFDVSGMGGDKEIIGAYVKELSRTPTDYKFRVLFFDEAHALTNDAADSLLKAVESAPKGVIFCFATTEFGRIRPALQSRLMHLEVKPLGAADAIRFLQSAAEKERIECEPTALALLAGIKHGYPRDLLIGLEQVSDSSSNGSITTALVRDVFDVDHTQALVEYFLALADGDSARQTEAICDWAELPSDKIKWISAFLLAVYYNNLIGMELVVDPLVYSIQQERTEILDRFQRRLVLEHTRDLIPYWRKLLEYWADVDGNLDDTAALLRLTLFQHVVNKGTPSTRPASVGLAREDEQPSQLQPSDSNYEAHGRAGAWEESPSGFIEHTHVSSIVNRASFFIQEYGAFFNVAFELHAERFGAESECDGRALVEEFLAALQRQAHIWDEQKKGRLAYLTLLEFDEGDLQGRVIAHLPRSKTCADNVWKEKIQAWSSEWRSESRKIGEALCVELVASKKQALGFHWKQVMNLCAGFVEEVEAWDQEQRLKRPPLLDLLKIQKRMRRPSGKIKGGLLLASDILQPQAIEQASAHGMELLSAFDDGAWDRIRDGWELREFHDRRARREERQKQIAKIEELYRDDDAQLRAEKEKIARSWPTDPRLRQRSWTGWFHEG